MLESTLTMRVNGRLHSGFRSGEVTLSLEQGTNSFSLHYADQWQLDGERIRIREGDRCELVADGEVLLDGYVDEARIEYDAGQRSFSCSGRAKTADLIDCSLERRTSWSDASLGDIVSDIAEPFGVSVYVLGSQGARFVARENDVGDIVGTFVAKRGETAWEVIQRAAKRRGFLPYTMGGDLMLVRAGPVLSETIIQRGVNVVRGSRTNSWADRFSKYVFRGQSRASDDVTGRSATQLKGEVVDPAITRYRPLLLQSGGDGPKDMGTRAILERNHRAGKSDRLSYTVPGWQRAEGLWAPNVRVRVVDDWLDVDAELLVTTVRFRLDAERGGYVTELELARPEAFDMADYPVRRGAAWT